MKERKKEKVISDQRCILAAPAALDRYLAALPTMSLIHFVPFAEATPKVFAPPWRVNWTRWIGKGVIGDK